MIRLRSLFWFSLALSMTIVLVDKLGVIRYSHVGEGAYEKTEMAIDRLLAEKISGR